MFKKLLCLFLCVAIILSITGCSPLSRMSEEELVAIETDTITEYLSKKYPEKTFEILNIECDRDAYNPFYKFSGFIDATVKDENGIEYSVCTNYDENKETAIKNCRDDIQSQEIKEAIKKSLYQLLNINEEDCENNLRIMFSFGAFYQKFNGDIIEFFKEEKYSKISFIYIYNTPTINVNSLNDEQKEFFRTVCDDIYMVDMPNDSNDLFKFILNSTITHNRIDADKYWPIIEDVLTYNSITESMVSNKPQIKQFGEFSYVLPQRNEGQTPNFAIEEKLEISKWDESTKELEEYWDITIENVVPLTEQHLADESAVYYLPQNPIAMIDGLKEYILFTYCNGQYSTYVSGRTQEFSLIEDYIYIDNMSDNTQWFIALCDVRK